MIPKPTSSDTWSVDAVAKLSSALARDAVVAPQTTAPDEPRTIDLASIEGWSELVRSVGAIAKSGGGRVVVHCIPANESEAVKASVFTAPIKSVATPKPPELKLVPKSDVPPNLQPVRIVTDPDAPALQPQDVDHLYPWRQKDLLRELNRRLGRRVLNSYDIQAIRRQNDLDQRPDFIFNLPGAGRRYSPAIADWIMEQHALDPEFFHRARQADHEVMKLRRQKPK
jgi:hypothetical protein